MVIFPQKISENENNNDDSNGSVITVSQSYLVSDYLSQVGKSPGACQSYSNNNHLLL
jgi:hypothetical protein